MYHDPRNVFEGVQRQGINEAIVYYITYDRQPSAALAVQCIDIASNQDVTTVVMPAGSPIVGALQIELPVLRALNPGQQVRVSLFYQDDKDNQLESRFVVEGLA